MADPIHTGGERPHGHRDWQLGLQTAYGYNVPQGTERAFAEATGQLSSTFQDLYGARAQAAAGRAGAVLDPRIMEMLYGAASGQVPSAAEQQMRSGLDQILASQMAARASQRGGRVGATGRLVSEQAAAAQQGVAGQTAQLRAQEQAAAQQLLAQAGQANLQAEVAQRQMNDAMVQNFLRLGHSIDEANRMADMQMAQLQANVSLGHGQMTSMNPFSGGGGGLGGIFQGAGSLVSGVGALVA